MISYTSSIFPILALQVVSALAATGSPTPASLQSCAAKLDGQLPVPTPSDWHFSGNIRRYYVAAEEVTWDYAPTGWDNWLGVPLNVSPRADYAGANQYGTKWLKALYRGYTDSSFTTLSEQPPWQGTQGPTIRSEVGDLIEIMFLNKLSKNYATMHSMGLAYTKSGGEGADYPNNTMPGVNVVLGDSSAVPPAVDPGNCVVYKWMVNDIAGPNVGEPAKVHSYHSYVALQQDSDAGLIGPQIVYAKGQMNSTMANYREIPLLYMIYDESDSWLSAQNKALLDGSSHGKRTAQGPSGDFGGHGQPASSSAPPQYQGQDSGSNGPPGQSFSAPVRGSYGPPAASSSTPAGSSSSQPSASSSGPSGSSESGQVPSINTNNLWSGNYTVWHPQAVNLAGARQFSSAPSFHTMNGYLFSNNPIYQMCLDDKVIWYVNAYGAASHVFHMHGNSFKYNGLGEYAISINDGVGKTLYMNATGQGLWQVICHVSNHQTIGMVSDYIVYPAGQCPLPALGA